MTTQKVVAGAHDTDTSSREEPACTGCTGVVHVVPLKVVNAPAPSTAAQNVTDAHDTEFGNPVRGLRSVGPVQCNGETGPSR
jgi:hypothetical protein